MKPLLSFIIPAYNAEPYLKECLDSIYRLPDQGYSFEVIVVDDGSTDGTAALLRASQPAYPRLRVITQENRGLGAARNAGLRMARGKYISFVDADDRLLGNKLPVDMLADYTIDIFSVNMQQLDFKGRRKPYRRYVPVYEALDVAHAFLMGRNLMPCVCGYLWRRGFLAANRLTFVEGLLHEDEDFTLRAFSVPGSFMALDVDWYERILRPESITTTADKERQRQGLRDMVTILQRLEEWSPTGSERRLWMQYKLDYLAVDILRILLRQRHPKAFRREITSALRRMGAFPLRWHWEWKHILFNLFTRLFL